MDQRSTIPVALVGCGTLGSLIASAIQRGEAGPYSLCAALGSSSPEKAVAVSSLCGGKACTTLDELLATKPRYVVEAATAPALKAMALPVLESGADLIILSAGALVDDDFVAAMRAAAVRYGGIVHIASGAIGGFDLAQAAKAVGGLSCRMVNRKPPAGLEGAPYLEGRTLSRDTAKTVFNGTVREAIAAFPKNVNVAAAMSFATLGVDAVTTTVVSDPALSRNTHRIELEGAFGRAVCEIEAFPSPDNPKSSMLAAYSVVALLRKLADPIRL